MKVDIFSRMFEFYLTSHIHLYFYMRKVIVETKESLKQESQKDGNGIILNQNLQEDVNRE